MMSTGHFCWDECAERKIWIQNLSLIMTPSYLFKRPKAWPFKCSNTQCSNTTLKQFFGNSHRIVWVCLIILWDWHLKGQSFGRLNRYEGVIIKDKFWIHIFFLRIRRNNWLDKANTICNISLSSLLLLCSRKS